MSMFWGWVIPSVIGFVFGYLTCWLVTRAIGPRPPGEAKETVSRRTELARVMFGVLLLVLSASTFAQSYRATSCLRDGIIERSTATGQANRAQIELLEAQIDADPTNNLVAIERYLTAARDLEQVRADNPLTCT